MRIGIVSKLYLALILVALLPLILLQKVLVEHFSDAMYVQISNDLKAIAEQKVVQIDDMVEEQSRFARILAQMTATRETLKAIEGLYFDRGINSAEYRRVRQHYLSSAVALEENEAFYDLFLISPSGEILMTFKEEADLSTNLISGPYRDTPLGVVVRESSSLLSTGFSEYKWYAPSSAYAVFVSTPIMEGGRLLGVLAIQLTDKSIARLSSDIAGLGRTGEIVIGQREGNKFMIVAPLRGKGDAALMGNLVDMTMPMSKALNGEDGVGVSNDYRGEKVLAAWQYLPRIRWGVVIKMSTAEAFRPIYQLQQWGMVLLVIVLGIATAAAFWLGRSFGRPVRALTDAATDIAEGDLQKRAPVTSNDELGQLAVAFNHMTDALAAMQLMLEKERDGLEEIVRQRTADIADANQHLMQEVNDRKAAQAELALAQTVFESSLQGIVVCDADNRIITVNPAFCEITGFAAHEVIGKQPGFNKSGRHDVQFYKAMWQAILEEGKWAGEIWDRRKSGETFPQWLSISVVRDDTGAIYRYIGVFNDISSHKQAEETIRYQANFDELTGLPNRRLFGDRLGQEIKAAARNNAELALLFIDLDHFKAINDSLGHAYGDKLLIESAQRIRNCLRDSDTVARLSGDEFTVILPDLVHGPAADTVAERIIEAMRQPFVLGQNVGYVSASIGISIYPLDADSGDMLIKQADQAMYEAKRLGRNRYSYFTPGMQADSLRRLQLSHELHLAILQRQFEVYLQPIHNLATGQVIKAEALVRWRHPTNGFVSPAEFIPLAEEVGLIGEIGDIIYEIAIQHLHAWSRLSASPIGISINLSPRQFTGRADFSAWINAVREAGLLPGQVTLEITEGLLLDQSPATRGKLGQLRKAGFSIAIDDFGTGYSSLSYLKNLDVDFIKVDQTFVRDLSLDSDDLAVVEAIILMAQKLDIQVIAEGVETVEQQELLRQAGCDFVQGYFYAKPMPIDDFMRYIAQDHQLKFYSAKPCPMGNQ